MSNGSSSSGTWLTCGTLSTLFLLFCFAMAGEWVKFWVVLFAIIIAALISNYQERRKEKAKHYVDNIDKNLWDNQSPLTPSTTFDRYTGTQLLQPTTRIPVYDVDRAHFERSLVITQQIVNYQHILEADTDFIYFLDNVDGLEFADKLELVQSYDNQRLAFLLLTDLLKCFEKLGHHIRETESRALLPIALYYLRLNQPKEPQNWENRADLIDNVYAKLSLRAYASASSDQLTGDYDFGLGLVLKSFDTEMYKSYIRLLHRVASFIALADGIVTTHEQEWLTGLRKQIENTAPTADNKNSTTQPINESEAIKKLNSLTGLQEVKQEVTRLNNFIIVNNRRTQQGLKTSPVSYHCVFTGNPGTGKTTVARILSDIYKQSGVIKKGQLIETDRSGLVAEYVGQTAVKTNKIIDSALDGVLFIDEAYTLVQGGDNDFGNEAIATLLKRMEDDRDRLIVILAGYSAEIQKFIDSNPGLQSRFNRYIHFPDYSADELLIIFKNIVANNDYRITPQAESKLLALLQKAIAEKDTHFGNARFVRNLFEQTIQQQATRLANQTNISVDDLQTITENDIK